MNGWQFRREQNKEACFTAVAVVTAFQSAGDIDVAEVVHKSIDLQRPPAVVRPLLVAVHTYN